MLKTLRVANYALIDQLEVDFSDGLHVLTGETGAGKSIIIGAISLLIGGRSQAEYIRDPSLKTSVEGYFDLPLYPEIKNTLNEMGIDAEEEYLILRREINPGGKSVARINGVTVPVSFLKETASRFINIYGQHDFQILSNPANHLQILDMIGKNELCLLKEQVVQAFERLEKAARDKKELEKKMSDEQNKKEFLEFQLREIENAGIENSMEDQEIDQQLAVLENQEKISRLVFTITETLYGQNAVYEQMAKAADAAEELSRYIEKARESEERLRRMYYEVEDIVLDIKSYSSAAESSPELLDQLNERKFELQRIKNKFKADLAEILVKKQEMVAELEVFSHLDEYLHKATLEYQEAEKEFYLIAGQLTKERKKTALLLEKRIARELSYLGMKHTVFTAVFSEQKPGRDGIDKAEFLISTNAGEAPKPIAKIASGGEMSRIMLSLKVIMNNDGISTMIFDEIDSGIGGETVVKVAAKLKEVAAQKQVLCVTHSPQVAAMSDKHYLIEKEEKDNRTYTDLRELDEEQIVTELSRMLGDTSLNGLEFAKKMRNSGLHFQKNTDDVSGT